MLILDGAKIARLRLSRGLASQRALAERTREVDPQGTGVAMRLVWDAENGKSVSPRTHYLIAKALDVPPETLVLSSHVRRALALLHSGSATIYGLALAAAVVAAVAVWSTQGYRGPAVFPVRAGRDRPPVTIGHVRFTGRPGAYTIAIRGSGFGASPFARPFSGTAPYFRIFDDTVHFEAGYSTDSVHLIYLHWDNGRILIAGLPALAGDGVVINVWNPLTHVGAAWGGNTARLPADGPKITSAVVSPHEIEIAGSGFGASPMPVPFASNQDYVVVCDGAYHPWGNGRAIPFMVGNKFSDTELAFVQWSDSRIVIRGFAGAPLANGMAIAPGDPVTLELWNPAIRSEIRRTAWGGIALAKAP